MKHLLLLLIATTLTIGCSKNEETEITLETPEVDYLIGNWTGEWVEVEGIDDGESFSYEKAPLDGEPYGGVEEIEFRETYVKIITREFGFGTKGERALEYARNGNKITVEIVEQDGPALARWNEDLTIINLEEHSLTLQYYWKFSQGDDYEKITIRYSK